MDWSQILGFMLIATIVVIVPGPNFLLVTNTVPLSGRNAGFANIGGFATAFLVHGTLSILGVSLIIANSELLFLMLKFAGATYLCWIGWQSVSAVRKPVQLLATNMTVNASSTIFRCWSDGFLTNLFNPKNAVFYLAAFPQYLNLDASTFSDAYVLVLIHIAANALWFVVVVNSMDHVLQAAGSRTVECGIRLLSGWAMITLGALFALSALASLGSTPSAVQSDHRFTRSERPVLSSVYYRPFPPEPGMRCLSAIGSC